jgi:hypothetical protein
MVALHAFCHTRIHGGGVAILVRKRRTTARAGQPPADGRSPQTSRHRQTHARERAVLKRLKFAAQSERYSAEQRSLLDETLDTDLQAVSDEIGQMASAAAPRDKQQPKRQPLPSQSARREIRHEPESTTCGCGCQLKRIGEDVAEKLDYVPGVFTVERISVASGPAPM